MWVNATIDCTGKLLSPAKGAKLIARGRVLKPGSLVSVAAAEVYSVNEGQEVLCATALVTMRNIKLS